MAEFALVLLIRFAEKEKFSQISSCCQQVYFTYTQLSWWLAELMGVTLAKMRYGDSEIYRGSAHFGRERRGDEIRVETKYTPILFLLYFLPPSFFLEVTVSRVPSLLRESLRESNLYLGFNSFHTTGIFRKIMISFKILHILLATQTCYTCLQTLKRKVILRRVYEKSTSTIVVIRNVGKPEKILQKNSEVPTCMIC